jgi:hypothetical protein
MTKQIITLHPDTRLKMLIDIMCAGELKCNLGDLHRINDDISAFFGTVEIDVEAIQSKIDAAD